MLHCASPRKGTGTAAHPCSPDHSASPSPPHRRVSTGSRVLKRPPLVGSLPAPGAVPRAQMPRLATPSCKLAEALLPWMPCGATTEPLQPPQEDGALPGHGISSVPTGPGRPSERLRAELAGEPHSQCFSQRLGESRLHQPGPLTLAQRH